MQYRVPSFACPKRAIPRSPVVLALDEAANSERSSYLSRYERYGDGCPLSRYAAVDWGPQNIYNIHILNQCRSQPSVSTLGRKRGDIHKGDDGGVFGLPLL
jgi:hypothetical protein